MVSSLARSEARLDRAIDRLRSIGDPWPSPPPSPKEPASLATMSSPLSCSSDSHWTSYRSSAACAASGSDDGSDDWTVSTASSASSSDDNTLYQRIDDDPVTPDWSLGVSQYDADDERTLLLPQPLVNATQAAAAAQADAAATAAVAAATASQLLRATTQDRSNRISTWIGATTLATGILWTIHTCGWLWADLPWYRRFWCREIGGGILLAFACGLVSISVVGVHVVVVESLLASARQARRQGQSMDWRAAVVAARAAALEEVESCDEEEYDWDEDEEDMIVRLEVVRRYGHKRGWRTWPVVEIVLFCIINAGFALVAVVARSREVC